MKILILLLTLISFNTLSADSEEVEISPNDVWVLDAKSNRFIGSGEVLFQMPQDALHTYRGREYGDWNEFAFIDSRKLIKLKTGYKVEILEPYFNEDIFKVKLLDGLYKNKIYFVITDDLLRKYKKLELNNEK